MTLVTKILKVKNQPPQVIGSLPLTFALPYVSRWLSIEITYRKTK
jgi:hypothetical protein